MPSIHSLFAGASLLTLVTAQISADLVGTWSTKSAKVLTGSGFYNPVNDSFIEPKHTGISYSFTQDGFYESAYYRAIANPAKPSCPQAIMQFQHGTFVQNADGSLLLTPFSVDGRQLESDPCTADTATYTRYNQTETMKKFAVSIDAYTKMKRLDLYQFDGTPINPMFLAFTPPQMLPTVTMNPTPTAAASSAKAKRTVDAGEEMAVPMNANAAHIKREIEKPFIHRIDTNMLWWAGVGMTIFGGAAYLL